MTSRPRITVTGDVPPELVEAMEKMLDEAHRKHPESPGWPPRPDPDELKALGRAYAAEMARPKAEQDWDVIRRYQEAWAIERDHMEVDALVRGTLDWREEIELRSDMESLQRRKAAKAAQEKPE
ncbi:MAG: hypothetical protein ACK4P2_07730 [Hyphomonas sp.]